MLEDGICIAEKLENQAGKKQNSFQTGPFKDNIGQRLSDWGGQAMRQQYSGVQVEPKSTLSGHGVRPTPSLAARMQMAARNFKWLTAPSSTSSA